MSTTLDSPVRTPEAPARQRPRPAGILRYAVPLVAGLVLVLAAGGLERSLLNQGTSLLLLALVAMAWNVIGGFGGLFSLGHSVFIGVGGYTLVVLLDHTDLPFAVVLVASGVLAAATGVVLGYPMLRLRGPYFAIGTLGVALAVTSWMLSWPFTKASQGYAVPPADSLRLAELFQLTVGIATAALLAVTALAGSPLGLRLVALRDDEFGARGLGVRRVRTMLPVWALSGFIAGLTGALVALQEGNLTPISSFSLRFVLDAIVICVIGGIGTLYGPLLGALLVFVMRQITADFADWAMLIEAFWLVVVIRLVPGGLCGILTRFRTAGAWRAVLRRRHPAGSPGQFPHRFPQSRRK